MAERETDPDLTELLADLTHELRRLEREVEPEPRGRLPTRSELARFTSEVAIPGLILVLQTQIRALELLRRTIRLAEGREPTPRSRSVKNRAEQLGTATLSQLDSVLTELQSAIDGRPEDDRAKRLLDDAKRLQKQIQSELETEPAQQSPTTDEAEPGTVEPADTVGIDVEEELRSLKGTLDEDEPPNDDDSSKGGSDTGTDSS